MRKLRSRVLITAISVIIIGFIIYSFYCTIDNLLPFIRARIYLNNSTIYSNFLFYLIISALIHLLALALLIIVNVHIWRKHTVDGETKEALAQRRKERLQAKKDKLEKEIGKIE